MTVIEKEKYIMNRKKNTVRNMIWGTLNKIISIIVPFIIRTIIIKVLGSEYLGLSSLFTSILQILNLTELGINSAIVFCLYKPIANNETDEICALMNLYKKLYRIIGGIILILGILVLPFLERLISGNIPQGINIYILYIIYLLKTVLTYWLFAYKSALLTAFQRNDIISNINSIVYIIQSTIQIFLLFVTKNYYAYIIIMPIMTIVNNIVCAVIAKKMYPQYICKGKIDDKTKDILKNKVLGLLVYKICGATRNSFDSIFISAFLGLNMVAIYNNYYMIMNSVMIFLGVITSSMLSGVGNSVVTESVDKNYKNMNQFNFMYMWISGWCTICLLCLYQPFMKLWLGEQYMLDFGCVILLCIYFYALQIGAIRAVYADAVGLWWETRYRAIIESVVNVLLNYILGKAFGIHGIIIATLISLIFINFFYGSQIIFKYYFKNKSVKEYFKNHFKYLIITVVISIITYSVCLFVNMAQMASFVIKILICIFIPNICYYIVYSKNENLIYCKNMIGDILKIKKRYN